LQIKESVSADIRPETPSTSHPPSEEANSTNPTTPSSVQQQILPTQGDTTPIASKALPRAAVPAVPVIPAVPRTVLKDASKSKFQHSEQVKVGSVEGVEIEQTDSADLVDATVENAQEDVTPTVPPPKAWSQPKAWGGVFKAGPSASSTLTDAGRVVPFFGQNNAESLTEALKTFNAEANDAKVTFLKPRGLVNTGNMCYMNSVSTVPYIDVMCLTSISGSSSPCLLCTFL
jgi:ubiquitin carboxyl-terminal hydrolase 10